MKQRSVWRGLLGLGLMVAIALSWSIAGNGVAEAALYQHPDVPGQTLYRAQERVRDADRHTWQVLTFTHWREGERLDALRLRIVGFPGAIALDHNAPLLLETTLGQKFRLPNQSAELPSPPPDNVAQFDLESTLPQLDVNLSVLLFVPSPGRDPVVLKIRPAFLQEWQQLLSAPQSS
jgi:hypothetical protein